MHHLFVFTIIAKKHRKNRQAKENIITIACVPKRCPEKYEIIHADTSTTDIIRIIFFPVISVLFGL